MSFAAFLIDTKQAARDAVVDYFSPLWEWPRALRRVFAAPGRVDGLAQEFEQRHQELRREVAMLSGANSQMVAASHDALRSELSSIHQGNAMQLKLNALLIETSAATYAELGIRLATVSAQLQRASRAGISDEEREALMRASNDALDETIRTVEAASSKARAAAMSLPKFD